MRHSFLKYYVTMHGLKAVLVDDESGQDLIEYALVIALIALAATASMSAVVANVSAVFSAVGSKLSSYTT